MNMSRYLWSVAHALQQDVGPHLDSAKAEVVLQHCMQVVMGVANALEPESSKALPWASFPGDADLSLLPGPPENAAARRDAAAGIAEISRLLDSGEADGLIEVGALIAWEKDILDGLRVRMAGITNAGPQSEVIAAGDIDPVALERFMRRRYSDPGLNMTNFSTILGGTSRQTASFAMSSPGMAERRLVVQRTSYGATGDLAFAQIGEQFDLLAKMREAGMRVPNPVAFETDPVMLGGPFLVTERCVGQPAQADFWDVCMEATVVLDLAREMAILHAEPPDDMAARLPRSRARYDRQGWSDDIEALAAEWSHLARWPSITMSAAIAWLRANLDCTDDRQCIVHNDMGLHNVLADKGRIMAILDWEQASIGHPGEDLEYCFPMVIAVIDWGRFMGAYCAAGGMPLTDRQVHFFALRGYLRLICLVMRTGRLAFDSGATDSVQVASYSSYFIQRQLHRLAGILETAFGH